MYACTLVPKAELHVGVYMCLLSAYILFRSLLVVDLFMVLNTLGIEGVAVMRTCWP
jgi:hypothetical protein